MSYTNQDVERVALDLWKAFNPVIANALPQPFDEFSPYPTKVEHIDDVMDGGRYRKLAKHVLENYGLDSPKQFEDRGGYTWVRQDDGRYSPVIDGNLEIGSKWDLGAIEAMFGIKEEK